MLIANVLQPLIDACQAILEFWHDLLGDFEGSWGFAIILLTFTVRIAILPLTFKGVKSMQRLQQLQPEIKQIQERYKGDRQRMNQENKGFLAIDDLSQKVTHDPVLLGVLIVLYVGTQLAASAVTALSADPTQRRIMFALPFVFTIFIVNFQAGLIVYWITTNVWTIGQQLVVRKLYPKPEPRTPQEPESRPARGKPPSPKAETASDGKPEKTKARAKAAAATGG